MNCASLSLVPGTSSRYQDRSVPAYEWRFPSTLIEVSLRLLLSSSRTTTHYNISYLWFFYRIANPPAPAMRLLRVLSTNTAVYGEEPPRASQRLQVRVLRVLPVASINFHSSFCSSAIWRQFGSNVIPSSW